LNDWGKALIKFILFAKLASIFSQHIEDYLHGFYTQLGSREYARYLSFNFPFLHERPLLPHLIACPWRLDQDAFKVFQKGCARNTLQASF
jgi:hypothetical protein